MRILPNSTAKLLICSIGPRKSCGWHGANCIAPARRKGLSRDLLIRALAHELQERAAGGASRAMRRRLQTLAGEFEKKSASFHPGIVPKTGTTLVRQWRGHAYTVVVREDGFEYEGQHYRSLTVMAERTTGAHWSGRPELPATRQRTWLAALIERIDVWAIGSTFICARRGSACCWIFPWCHCRAKPTMKPRSPRCRSRSPRCR